MLVCPEKRKQLQHERDAGCLLESEDAERTVGFVAGVISHPFAPKVIGEDAPEAGARSDIWIIGDGPYIIMHELAPKRVTVAERAHRHQRGVPEQPDSRSRPRQRAEPPPHRGRSAFSPSVVCCHVGPRLACCSWEPSRGDVSRSIACVLRWSPGSGSGLNA